ncbi:MAG: putative oxidoreductase, aryl-alcohol dehydrogenase like protein [Acidimicrobiaceae bacterium]|nr:putative oxidoreductase, aryl-alcohol dehydrogenase like protein [Acidimicrobiaceae bacterium]
MPSENKDSDNIKSTLESAGSFALGAYRVNRIGYGAMQLAGDNVFGPPRDRDEALRVLRAAIDHGVNHIDTAQYYGPGTVNEVIREALYPYPSDLAIVSKVAARRDDRGAVVAYDDPDQLREGIEDNLATLGVDRLAAVNLRLMDDSRPGERFDAQLASLVQARDEGLIGGIGLSNISREHLQRALGQTQIVCVQNLFNLADQRSLGLLRECAAHGIAFVPFCPLGWPRGVQNLLLTSPALATLGERLHATPAQIALAWLLDVAPNVLLIPGTRTRSHLTENILSATVRMDHSVREMLDRHFPSVAN